MSRLVVPEKIFEQHTIILGKTGAGKSSAARDLVEYLLDHKKRVVIVTPKADWWGLKLDADGKHPGYPVPVFGGQRADMPLHHLSGKTIAELLGTGNRSAILQMREFMPNERAIFWNAFASTLYRVIQGQLFLVIDEVHNYAPKGQVEGEATKMLHWSLKLAGEARGLGINLIVASQRPAKVHNDMTTSCETLIAMRVTTHWDRDAIKLWMSGCGDKAASQKILDTLAQMKRGDAWVWSPEIEFGPERVHFPMFKTYDSFRPQTEHDVKGLKGWAHVDLDEVKKKLEHVVKEAEANDPAKLKAKIRELEAEMRKKHLAAAPATAKTDPRAAQATIDRAVAQAVRQTAAQSQANIASLQSAIKRQGKALADIAMAAAKAANVEMPKLRAIEMPKVQTPALAHSAFTPQHTQYRDERIVESKKPRIAAEVHASTNGHSDLTPYQLDILRGLAELEAIGKSDASFPLAGVAAGKSAASSTFEKYRSRLQASGLVSYPRPGRLALTDEGRKIAPAPDAPLTNAEIQQRCLSLLSPYQADLVRALIDVYPRDVSRDELGDLAKKQSTSSTFEKYVSSLRSMEILEYPAKGTVKAADWLFLD